MGFVSGISGESSIEREQKLRKMEKETNQMEWIDGLEIMSNSIQRIARVCEANEVFTVAGKDGDLGRGNLVQNAR